MSTLIVIENAHKELYDAYNSETDDVKREEILQKLYELEAPREEKHKGCCEWHEELLAEVAKVESVYERIKEKRRLAIKRLEDFEKYMEACISIGESFESGPYGFKWVKNPPSVEIIDEKLVPECYKRYELVEHIEKRRVGDDLKIFKKNGEGSIPGAILIDDKYRLKFK